MGSRFWWLVQRIEAVQILGSAVKWVIPLIFTLATWLLSWMADLPAATYIPLVVVAALGSAVTIRIAVPLVHKKVIPEAILVESAQPATERPTIGKLRIEYDKKSHFTEHPNGDIEVKFLLRNIGPARAKRIRVKLESVIPKNKQSLALSTQYPAIKLQVNRENLGFDLHPDDFCEVKLIRSVKSGGYIVDGYDINNEPGSFALGRDRYELKVVATGLDGGTDQRTFLVTPKRNGGIDVEILAG